MGLLPNMMVDIVIGSRSARTRVLRVLDRDIYLEALADIESELTPTPGQRFELGWIEESARWSQAARMQDVLETLPIMLVNLEGEARPSDQRRTPRVQVTVPVEYGIPNRERYLTTTLDLSEAGLRFPSAIPLWTDLNLVLGLRLGTDALKIRATVVRTERRAKDFRGRPGWETAVRFLSVGAQDRLVLQRFVSAHLPIQNSETSSV